MRLDGTSSRTGSSRTGGERGLSAVVGVVLLVVIVVLGSIIAAIVGTAALGDTRKSVEVTRAEGAMAEFDARVADTALGSDGVASRAVEFGHTGPDGYLTVSRDSWIQVSVTDAETGVESANVTRATLGTVTYAHGETTVAYEGGGVWRGDGANTTMISPPEFHFRNTTLTLPVITVDGDGELRERLQVVRAGPPERKYPNASAGWTNRVENSKVLITVHSDYYVAWGQYFEDTTDGVVTYDHGAKTVAVKFLALPRQFSLSSGIVATSGTGTFALHGNGAYTDSYDSTNDTWANASGKNGDVAAVGVVELYGGASLLGDMWGGETVSITGSTVLDGDVYVVENGSATGCNNSNLSPDFSCESGASSLTGTVRHTDGVAEIEPIDGYVTNSVNEIQSQNNNSDYPTLISTYNTLTLAPGSSGTLGPGQYYFSNLTVDKSTLYLQTTANGDITIAVRDYAVLLQSSNSPKSKIEVLGPGNVTVLILGEAETTPPQPDGYNFVMEKGSSVNVSGDESPRFRIYGTSTFKAHIQSDKSPKGDVRFVGIIYAPAGLDGEGSVTIKQAEVFGGVVTGSLDIGQYGAVHYDEAIRLIKLPRSPTISRLEYMHVAVHPVDVTNR